MSTHILLDFHAYPDLIFPANGIYHHASTTNYSTIALVFNDGLTTFEVQKHDITNSLLVCFRHALAIMEESPSYFFFHDTLSPNVPGYFTLIYEENEAHITVTNGTTIARKMFSQSELIKTIQYLESIIKL